MDLIRIHGIRLSTTIGVYDWEQKKPQSIIVHLDLGIPTNKEAFEEDNLEGTIDYGAVVQDLQEWLIGHQCKLLEFLAERIAKRFFERYPISWIKVEVFKPRVLPDVELAAVCIERHRPAS